MAKKQPTDALLKELRDFGLTYPGAHTKSPWPGHLDLAVNDKTFAYLSVEGDPFKISCKLPQSSAVALMLPFSEPTGYGLGKSGWVSATFETGPLPDAAMLKSWIDESYRAQAPKKLVRELDARPAAGAADAPRAKATNGAAKVKPGVKASVAKVAARNAKARPGTKPKPGASTKQPKAKPSAKVTSVKSAPQAKDARTTRAKPASKASNAGSARARTR